ncbi:MAG: hypothetical protein RL065_2046 [Bacteroidota bacterium]|jgi:hypothetical protein
MKKTVFQVGTIILIFYAIAFMNSCAPKQLVSLKSKNDSAVFKFTSTVKNLGFVKEGFTPSATFEFENIGNADLLITNVETECNCTIAEYSTNKILPNGKGYIKIDFKSDGNLGAFNKTITIHSNATEKQKIISIKGVVISSKK